MSGWPDDILADPLPTPLAGELIAYLHDAPISAGLRCWIEDLAQDVNIARAQIPLFGRAGMTVNGDWETV